VELVIGLPLGLFPAQKFLSSDLLLQPGDRVVFVTDGMLERNAASLDLMAAISETQSIHPRESDPKACRRGCGGDRSCPRR
jgi:serine phosphatase RsbU (regulator of sigma subunit)